MYTQGCTGSGVYLMVYIQLCIFSGVYSVLFIQWCILNGAYSVIYIQWCIFNGVFSGVYSVACIQWWIFSGAFSVSYASSPSEQHKQAASTVILGGNSRLGSVYTVDAYKDNRIANFVAFIGENKERKTAKKGRGVLYYVAIVMLTNNNVVWVHISIQSADE